ncbi:hypothetical protein [Mycobacterium sp. E802]|uniref:hypothetical protein n=1 Tax=Mycobacterium sp. E802 TaxID=1834152 RepID=UPI0009ECFF3B|nr:hypothetical protein [Mycobacterium sp. E802]
MATPNREIAVGEMPPEEYPHEWVDRYGPQTHVRPPDGRHDATLVVIRCVAGVIGGGAAALWALIVFVMLSSAFSTDPASDPHGYGIVFGIIAYLPLGLIWTFVLPFVAPRHRWGRAFAVSMLSFTAMTAGVIVALNVSGAG